MYRLALITHESTEKIYLHAEVDAILKCRELHNAYRIFISRVLKSGEYGLAKPCPICEEAIRQAGIIIVEHT
jgi:deoxycytidylate deaminase